MLEVKAITKKFSDKLVLSDLSFKVRSGEVVGLLGPNGAGKTTTMRIVATLLEPDAGQVVFKGTDVLKNPLRLREYLGYMPENNPLYDDLLAFEYLEFAGRLKGFRGDKLRKVVTRAVAETGIESVYYRPLNQLSKGFKQRVGLAQAILGEPALLILDEPTEGLDPNQRLEIRALIKTLGKDRTVVVSTHVLQEVTATCDRVVIINKGHVAADATPAELLATAQGSRLIKLGIVGHLTLETIKSAPGVTAVRRLGKNGGVSVFEIEAAPESDPRPQIFDAIVAAGQAKIIQMTEESATLESVFQAITKE